MTTASPQAVVVMGVSGVGKTTIAKALVTLTGWTFAEGDDFHSAANKAKMHAGIPLTDSDRWPWLQAIGEWISEATGRGESVIVTCSALKVAYRDLLRENRPMVRFCDLTASPDLIDERLHARQGHFMSASLLRSQLDALEPLTAAEKALGSVAVPVDVADTPEETARNALVALGLPAH